MELPKKLDIEGMQESKRKYWQDKKIYKFNKESNKETFSIDTPPPYASADHLHVGHGMHYSQFEFVARFKRMRGYNVYFPMGFDDNGLPTGRFVEKKYKINQKNTPRDKFIELCKKEAKIAGKTYEDMFNTLGFSIDWDLLYQTIGDRAQTAAQKSFIDLYKKGLVYQKEAPVIWDTQLQTTLAQADLEDVEMKSHFNDIIFKHNENDLIISTTRPELLPACVALFANPEDERYKNLKGKFAKVPLFNYEVPILFDESVEIEKGTGLMMVCTFGDKEDIVKWNKYNLPLREVIQKDGTLSELAEEYAGLSVKEAREKIIEKLKEKKLLIRQKEITHAVNVGERSGIEIEFINSKQWFIRVLDKKTEIMQKANKVNWYPEHMKIRFEHWVQNLGWDWCISRQRFYGVPFPIWYSKKTGEVILPDESELPIDPTLQKPKKLPDGHSEEDIIAEADVMDTWMTSSVTPEINSHWGMLSDNPKLRPMSLRPQAHDIIRTWAFYTIVKSLYHHDEVPWKTIMISGHGQDSNGKKMSKSKGNFVIIEDCVKEYGADAFRYWASTVKLGDDLPYQEKDLQTGKKTVTKIFNASKFVIMNLEDYEPDEIFAETQLETIDRWLITKAQKTIQKATEFFEEYEYSKAKQETDKLFWQYFCDQYLELVKYRIYGEDAQAKKHAQQTLYFTLRKILKLYAPIMPFITEEIWQLYYKNHEESESIHTSAWPKYDENLVDEESEKAGDLVIQIINEIRKYKAENQLSLKEELQKITITGTAEELELLTKTLNDIKNTGRIQEIELEEAEEFSVIIK